MGNTVQTSGATSINTTQSSCRIVAALFIGLLLVPCPAEPSTTTTVQPNTCSSIQYSAPSGAINNIVFKFDRSYPCGQFINGDWWVSPEGVSGAGVKITEILPLATNDFNGFEVNPTSKTNQSFDSRVAGYSSNLMPTLPLLLNGNASVVKAVSVPPVISPNKRCRPCIQYAAVLTVSPNVILDSENMFRPGYFGSNKLFLKAPLTGWDALLPKYPAPPAVTSISPAIQQIKDSYAGVRLDHLEGWTGEYLHPKDNMPSYTASIATDNAVAILRLMLSDFNFNIPSHKEALVNYLQMAVDLQSMASNGVTWPANGGHGNGRKLPLLVGGLLLKKTPFELAISKSSFSEDTQLYRSGVTGKVLFGSLCTDSQYWSTTLTGRGKRDCRDPYQLIDGGGWEIGAAYQFCCTAMPWKYTALGISMLKLKVNWDNAAFFEYADRWVTSGAIALPDKCAAYDGTPANYGITFGPLSGSSNCIVGSGRYISQDHTKANMGHYGNKFGDQLWLWFKALPP